MENLVVPTLEAIIANADTSVDPGVKGSFALDNSFQYNIVPIG